MECDEEKVQTAAEGGERGDATYHGAQGPTDIQEAEGHEGVGQAHEEDAGND
jgi:hypothetical protein